MNGLYLQLHSYMLRIAIPYGTLSAQAVADARPYRAQIRPRLRPFHDAPEPAIPLGEAAWTCPTILRDLATSRCIACRRAAIASATSRPIISRARRPTRSRTRAILSEIIRQWSTLHPEFTFLPRKFKIAVSGSAARSRRAEIPRHRRSRSSRTMRARPAIACLSAAAWAARPTSATWSATSWRSEDILAFLEAVMRVYNEYGRRDNIYKARIKILAHQIGADEMRRQVEREFAEIKKSGTLQVPAGRAGPHRRLFRAAGIRDAARCNHRNSMRRWRIRLSRTGRKPISTPHNMPGYAIATISLKPIGGDARRLLRRSDGCAGRADGRIRPDEIRVTP